MVKRGFKYANDAHAHVAHLQRIMENLHLYKTPKNGERVIIVVDPPGGWRYGFPRQYNPRPGETEEEWFKRVGYPQSEIDKGMLSHVRRWWAPEKEAKEYEGSVAEKPKRRARSSAKPRAK
jgi:hypothetical protein